MLYIWHTVSTSIAVKWMMLLGALWRVASIQHIQGTFGEHLTNIHGTFKEAWGTICVLML
jgi:hypothetical protein